MISFFMILGLCHQDMTSLPPLLYHLRTCLRGKKKIKEHEKRAYELNTHGGSTASCIEVNW